MNLLHLLIGTSGRIGRGQFWLSVLILVVAYVGVILVAMLFTSSLDTILYVGVVTYFLFVLLSIPIALKRLHDRSKPDWWLIVFYGVPLGLQLIVPLLIDSDADSTPVAVSILQYAGMAVLLWALVELGFLRGTIGANGYGPDPVAPKLAKRD
jgi:uncharacterized membrane protein YhaH (DUF805 family)